jgi:DNA-binding NtrC family response regulator
MTSVLILDGDSQVARCLVGILAQRGIRAQVAERLDKALHFVDRHHCDLAFLGLGPILSARGVDLEVLRLFRVNQPELPLVLMASVEELQAAARLPGVNVQEDLLLRTATQIIQEVSDVGCWGCLIKPLNPPEVQDALDSFLPNRHVAHLATEEEGADNLFRIVGSGPKLQQVVALAERIAPTSAPVLIGGESGAGKELISLLIHHRSRRATGPYVKVNCAALSDSLLESELFGHEKGAFTGALARRKGRFEQAHGGTLLLDEITETPPHFQAKLLRIIEQQEFERVGGNENVRVNVRVISTTNRNLAEEVRQGRFRQDLYYRLSSTRLVVPALRERREDLPDLVWYFVNQYARESKRTITKLDPTMMALFAQHDWPGNIRQLRNVVRTSLILGTGSVLSLADVSWLCDGVSAPASEPAPVLPTPETPDPWQAAAPAPAEAAAAEPSGLGGLPLDVIERRAILETLQQTSGNRKKAAEVLGISDRTLRDRIRRYREQLCLESV